MTQQGRNAGLRLRQFRIRSGSDAETLGASVGWSRARFYRYERGDINKLQTVLEIATLLGLTFEQTIAPISPDEMAAMLGIVGGETELGLDRGRVSR